ncbi:MAG: hypothetical protein V3W41_01675 [Planctomycetota bacterium]
MTRKAGRPKKLPDEQRLASTRADLTMAEKEALGHEARLNGVSEAEFVRRRLGFGASASRSQSTPALISALEKRGVDAAELFSRDYFRTEAEAAGLSEAGLVRRMLDFANAPPAKRQTAALISELNTLGLELSSVGNNANQLALASHTNRRAAVEWEAVVARIRELGDQIEGCLERVMIDDD